MGSLMAPLCLSDLERSHSRSLEFIGFVSRKGAMLSHMLLLNINRKSYISGVQWYHSNLTLSDIERSKSRAHIFRNLYIVPTTCILICMSHKGISRQWGFLLSQQSFLLTLIVWCRTSKVGLKEPQRWWLLR